jgi:hypothetical protein
MNTLEQFASLLRLDSYASFKPATIGFLVMDTDPASGWTTIKDKGSIRRKALICTPADALAYYALVDASPNPLKCVLLAWNNGFMPSRRGLPDPDIYDSLVDENGAYSRGMYGAYKFINEIGGIWHTDQTFKVRMDSRVSEVFNCFKSGVTNNKPIMPVITSDIDTYMTACTRGQVCELWKTKPVSLAYVVKYRTQHRYSSDVTGLFFIGGSDDVLDMTTEKLNEILTTLPVKEYMDYVKEHNKGFNRYDTFNIWDAGECSEYEQSVKRTMRTLIAVIHMAVAFQKLTNSDTRFTVFDYRGESIKDADPKALAAHWQPMHDMIVKAIV